MGSTSDCAHKTLSRHQTVRQHSHAVRSPYLPRQVTPFSFAPVQYVCPDTILCTQTPSDSAQTSSASKSRCDNNAEVCARLIGEAISVFVAQAGGGAKSMEVLVCSR
jgi:hypothetical protein